jgi:hypothetical protein
MNINRELVGMVTLLGLLIGYLIHEHERVAKLESAQAERPEFRERRDRENDDIKQDVRELRQKLLCPCHD